MSETENEELENQESQVKAMYEDAVKQLKEMDPTDLEQLQEFLAKYRNRDPRDFMTPTQREIANMTPEELETEYNLVEARQSNRGRMQRELIISRWEYEQKIKNENK
jgi:hypothetical protein